MTNTGINVSDFKYWRDCLGQCMICGQPLGLKPNTTSKTKRSEVSTIEEDDVFLDDSMERLLLTEECPIRMCLTRFNMLGQRQNCHIVDQYTFLTQDKKNASFEEKLKLQKRDLENVDESFKSFIQETKDAEKSQILQGAKAMCQRMGNAHLFSGCRRCNLTMNSPNTHINVVYRFFPITRNKDIPVLEKNTVESIKIKKTIQQIAFYFTFNKRENTWNVKDETQALKDINIWRCISNLVSWGITGKYRHKLIAIFHGAYYLYMNDSLYSALTFEDWHIFIFRNVYTNKSYSDEWKDHWFGLNVDEAKVHFDISTKRGEEWYNHVISRLESFSVAIEAYKENVSMDKIRNHKENILKMVRDEKTLLAFMIQKSSAMGNVEKGIEKYLSFFKFNIRHSYPRNLLRACKPFETELAKEYRKWKNESPNQLRLTSLAITDDVEDQ